jgi:hypothetical protein
MFQSPEAVTVMRSQGALPKARVPINPAVSRRPASSGPVRATHQTADSTIRAADARNRNLA